MTCTHDWKRREARPCVMHKGEICPVKFSYSQCTKCEARRLSADGHTYIITDDSIEAA